MEPTVIVHVDGCATQVEEGSTLLTACDSAGRYVPRLCRRPGISRGLPGDDHGSRCGLCAVRMTDGSITPACSTLVVDGAEVCTDDDGLRSLRIERLATLLAGHPHICLSCSDRDGCSRDTCVHGVVAEARCCDRLGVCELGTLVEYVDSDAQIPRREVAVSRAACAEGRIRREPGLCVSCGRCVRICESAPEAGQALEMGVRARPKRDTLRDSGCTFCGLCAAVCPTGAVTAPGTEGARWVESKRQAHHLPGQVLPPAEQRLRVPEELDRLPATAGTFTLVDAEGLVLQISGVADLRQGAERALDGLSAPGGLWVRFEAEPLYTQRESELLAQYTRDHGCLPARNDLGDDLFDDDVD